MATYRVTTNGPTMCAANLRIGDVTLQPASTVDLELDELELAALRAFVGATAPIASVETPGRTGPAQAVEETAPPVPGVVPEREPEPPKPALRRRARAVGDE